MSTMTDYGLREERERQLAAEVRQRVVSLKGAFTAVRWLTRGFTIAESVARVLTKS
ncbi:hypothetical protein [Streptomyces rapamycinicus]|uniref:Uncharacterized protein n=2 Tax=Streptomyces rapamycinicus TaxID=1226757 RepID=A0A0A0NSB8_STRRN|nr:hypothetical protein [Streptomyces rapamycinicus]AGP59253.1 hypothetical protein M271_39340 [Streptomyces rapamycinicus NRRL 5491]MBB4786997.1 hypothetical protein [Streptomyces rapamycinicus]RLV77552.1 hypothetical protein D3C57_104245 [Streptomyces rapamycinicus NRRL 5491]UTO67004.1 hypothetical protein LJB45_34950 [Streptomyces rapamycinicus]UTP34961.1 hypothetical protein LIV37_40085 [Streptomyces rapamycinicus NRRL 5491]